MGYGHPKWLAGFVGKMLINHWIWGYPISLGHCKLNENVRIHSRPLTVQNHQQYMCFHTSPHSSYEKTDTSFLRIGRAHNDWGTKISESLLTPDRREDETIRIFVLVIQDVSNIRCQNGGTICRKPFNMLWEKQCTSFLRGLPLNQSIKALCGTQKECHQSSFDGLDRWVGEREKYEQLEPMFVLGINVRVSCDFPFFQILG